MKKVCLIAMVAILPSLSAFAQCYESGTVFDARGNYGEGTLCQFGGEDEGQVLPYYQRHKTNHMDYLFSEDEQMGMLKSLVLRGKQGGDGRLQQAVAGASRPLRRFRGFGFSRMGGLGGF